MRSPVDQLPIELVKIFNKRKNNSSSLEMVLSDTENEETSIQESLLKFIKTKKKGESVVFKPRLLLWATSQQDENSRLVYPRTQSFIPGKIKTSICLSLSYYLLVRPSSGFVWLKEWRSLHLWKRTSTYP